MLRTGAVVSCGVISTFCNPCLAHPGTGGIFDIQTQRSNNKIHVASYVKEAKYGVRGYSLNSTTPAIISRTPADNLQRIRTVLNPSMSDLASVFGVSRQTIYNWMSGEQPKAELAAKLDDLALAADILAAEGIEISGHILKRKISQGRTLLEIANAGESSAQGAELLVRILRTEAEQRRTIASRLAERKTPTLINSDMGIPFANERA